VDNKRIYSYITVATICLSLWVQTAMAGNLIHGRWKASAATMSVSTSRYVTWLSGDADSSEKDAYNVACTQAKQETPGAVVLGFGRQLPGAVSQFQGRRSPKTLAEVQRTLVAYANGLSTCSDGAKGWILVAQTSSDHLNDPVLASEFGAVWANLVLTVREQTSDTRVEVRGGSDIEPGWGSYEAARAWTESYADAAPKTLLIAPSADGCPQQLGGSKCANGWTIEGLAYLTWGIDAEHQVYPQVYHYKGAQARQWAVIAQEAIRQGLTPLFGGIMTQDRACSRPGVHCTQTGNTPEVSLAQINSAFAELGIDISLSKVTDIGWG
jgi:hypothetical protein